MWAENEHFRKSIVENAVKFMATKEGYDKCIIPLLKGRLRKCKIVIQYDLDFNYVTEHATGPAAALFNNLKYNQSKNIVYAAKYNENRPQSEWIKCYNYYFVYAKDDD